ncbi:tRNA(Ile)-lysidine synthetase-like protein [Novosphingobium sp. Rr 2-17]|uniref:tRNA lysidine(34) synthetase TilS n=1 Tax=Novosphingobium sp. Rr 2-17 TaxID=555793 RepID=UPI0002697B15|nr:tRNA lysidine(34) synthetase TilS [Novosphingobium sp. Rr 2-17]EIZ80733.1 tRNA(Ile)-lysidine synthetase-like protein [Novosphingobium sp. Rr 2-17]
MDSRAANRALTLPETAVARLRAVLDALWPEATDTDAKLGIAVSGGPDSVALLLLAATALPGRVEAATVDHGLRPESAQEAVDVAQLCDRLGVPHATLPVTVAPGNIQAEARAARYAAMARWVEERGLAALATAHHADDQAETLLMRLNRASGVAGLAGARARGIVPNTPIPLLRPVLDWRRTELAEVLATAGVAAAQDPSNTNDRFDRVRIRKALAEADWLDVAAIARSAALIAEADMALEWMAALEWRSCVKKEPMGLRYRPQAPRAVALRVVARIVRELGEDEPRGSALARLLDMLSMGQPASIGQLVARPNAGGWSFAKAPARRAPPSPKA